MIRIIYKYQGKEYTKNCFTDLDVGHFMMNQASNIDVIRIEYPDGKVVTF